MRAAIGGVLALAVAACAVVPRVLEAEMPGRELVEPVRVVVVDRVGIVTSVSAEGMGPSEGRPGGVFQLAGDHDALHVAWIGGMCDRLTTLTVESRDDTLVITEATERAVDGCLLEGIQRQVAIGINRPVDPLAVVFRAAAPGG